MPEIVKYQAKQHLSIVHALTRSNNKGKNLKFTGKLLLQLVGRFLVLLLPIIAGNVNSFLYEKWLNPKNLRI